MSPKVELPAVPPGAPKVTLFVKLKNSARNSSFARSRTGMYLMVEKSQLNKLSVRVRGRLRGALPMVHGLIVVNALVLNHRLIDWLSTWLGSPITFGQLPPPVGALAVTEIGLPLWKVRIVFTCQPFTNFRH